MSYFLFYSTYINFLKLKQSKLEQLVDSVKNAQICRGIESAGLDKAVVEINNVMQTEIGLSLDDPCFKELNSMPLGLEIPDSFLVHSTISWFSDIVDYLITQPLYDSMKDRLKKYLDGSIFELTGNPLDSIIDCYRVGCSKRECSDRKVVFEHSYHYDPAGMEHGIEQIIAYVILEKVRNYPWFILLEKYLGIMASHGMFQYLIVPIDKVDFPVGVETLSGICGIEKSDARNILEFYALDDPYCWNLDVAMDNLRYYSYRDIQHWDCMRDATRLTMGFFAYLLYRMASLSEIEWSAYTFSNTEKANTNVVQESVPGGGELNQKNPIDAHSPLVLKWPKDKFDEKSGLWNNVPQGITDNKENCIIRIFEVLSKYNHIDKTQDNLDLLVCFLTKRKTIPEIKPIIWETNKESLCYFINQVAKMDSRKWKKSEGLFKYLSDSPFVSKGASKNADSSSVSDDFKAELKKAIDSSDPSRF